jgi:hypothetical protein
MPDGDKSRNDSDNARQPLRRGQLRPFPLFGAIFQDLSRLFHGIVQIIHGFLQTKTNLFDGNATSFAVLIELLSSLSPLIGEFSE